ACMWRTSGQVMASWIFPVFLSCLKRSNWLSGEVTRLLRTFFLRHAINRPWGSIPAIHGLQRSQKKVHPYPLLRLFYVAGRYFRDRRGCTFLADRLFHG